MLFNYYSFFIFHPFPSSSIILSNFSSYAGYSFISITSYTFPLSFVDPFLSSILLPAISLSWLFRSKHTYSLKGNINKEEKTYNIYLLEYKLPHPQLFLAPSIYLQIHNFIFINSWVKFHCVNVPHLITYLLVSRFLVFQIQQDSY